MKPRVRHYLDLRRAFRAMVPGFITALPPLFWVLDATRRASLTSLGRDQGIFQYIAWAWLRGERGYSEVRDVNGPLTPLVHMIFLALGGREEHRFRTLDLTVTGACFAFAGWCLPGIWRSYSPSASKTWREVYERTGWAFAAWVVLSGQYLMYIFWDIAQRESFFDWFLIGSTGLLLLAHRRMADDTRAALRGTTVMLAAAGALSAVTWFGKPTYALFTLAHVATLVFDRVKVTRRRRLAIFGCGVALGWLSQVIVLVRYADPAAFLRIYLVDVPQMYRFIWPRTAYEIFSLEGYSTAVALSMATSFGMLGLIAQGLMPRRALSIAIIPLFAIASVVAQSKGFPYHFHPVSLGLNLQWLLILVWLWERTRQTTRAGSAGRMVPVLFGAALAVRVALLMPSSTYIQSLWLLTKARDTEERESHDYLVYFTTSDFFPWEIRETATYLHAHTKPEDRVQIYGMDPYILFLAERKSATPYIYAYDLNCDAALSGGHLPEPAGLHPTFWESQRIREICKAHEVDFLARMKAAPPAAMVFLDKAPLITWQEAVHDFQEHVPESHAWVSTHYTETADFNGFHVWMRNDLAAGLPKVAPPPPAVPSTF